MKAIQKIPTVNLNDFTSGNPDRKAKFVNEIGKAYEEIGFVALKGHFLKDELIDELYHEIKQFFNLPLETKLSERFTFNVNCCSSFFKLLFIKYD